MKRTGIAVALALLVMLVGCSTDDGRSDDPTPATAVAGSITSESDRSESTTSASTTAASNTSAEAGTGTTESTSAERPEPSAELALRTNAEAVDRAAIAGDAEAALALYSPRCIALIGSADRFSQALEAYYSGWDPQPEDWMVRVDGASGTVVTIYGDGAPAHAEAPKTWTLIDGEWRFDNC